MSDLQAGLSANGPFYDIIVAGALIVGILANLPAVALGPIIKQLKMIGC